MTNKQINQRIAETCGWKCAGHSDQLKSTEGWEFGYRMVIRPNGQLVTHDSIPKYCECLNAMHEAEKTFFPAYATVYSNKLATTTDTKYSDDTEYFCATARQRAEAFLRTLDKWRD